MEDLLRVSRLILKRLDVEAAERGEGAEFICASYREDLRRAIEDEEKYPDLHSALKVFINPTGHTDACTELRGIGVTTCTRACARARSVLERVARCSEPHVGDEEKTDIFIVEYRERYEEAVVEAVRDRKLMLPTRYADCTAVYLDYTLEGAREFCRQNTDYAEHDEKKLWHFAILGYHVLKGMELDMTYIEFVDWDGVPEKRGDEDAARDTTSQADKN